MTKILIPIDKSAGSRAALPVANWLARGMDADALILVCVGELPETPELAHEEDRALDQVLSSAATALHDIEVERRVSKAGDPARGIVEVARDEHVDLIVMATHARSALSELAHGSVAEAVVRSGVAPVTLVRCRTIRSERRESSRRSRCRAPLSLIRLGAATTAPHALGCGRDATKLLLSVTRRTARGDRRP